MPIHHSDFYTYQFSPVAHNFHSLALYPHGAIEAFVLAVPYANISDILDFISLISDMERCYIILEYWHVIHMIILQLFKELGVK